MIKVKAYRDADGNQPFTKWFNRLNKEASQKVVAAMRELKKGNFSNTKRLGGGISEYRINFGPGYRIYFGKAGETVVMLLGGGTKERQKEDIDKARKRWIDCKHRFGKKR